MAKPDPNIAAHLEWIGFVRPTGLVVSAPTLDRAGTILDRPDVEGQRLRELATSARCTSTEEPQPWLLDFRAFTASALSWSVSPTGYAGMDEAPIPAELAAALSDSGGTLRPHFAVRTEPLRGTADALSSRLLVRVCEPGDDCDVRDGDGLEASPHGRMERLLRHTGVPAGMLFNGLALRLISAGARRSARRHPCRRERDCLLEDDAVDGSVQVATRSFGSTMKDDAVYTPSDCFETDSPAGRCLFAAMGPLCARRNRVRLGK